MKSHKTTAAGIAGLVASLCTMVLVPLLDADEATKPMWAEFFGLAVPFALGLIAARDHNVTSEQAGAAPKA